jgi:hypothetical protein
LLASAERWATAAPAASEQAIVRTIAYAGLFQYPLTLTQLHRALMDVPLTHGELREHLQRPFVRDRIEMRGELVFPAGCESWLELREARRAHSAHLLERHAEALALLARFPFVRLVALSGACAHDNATDPDVDVFLVTAPRRAWAVTLALTIWSRLRGLRRSLCLNYVVDEHALSLPERDVFTATEVVGLKPLAGRSAYRRFVENNAWVGERYPNFFASHVEASRDLPEVAAPRWLERVLDFGPAQLLEMISRGVLGARLRAKGRGRPGVSLSAHRLKLHTQDHAPRLRAAFAEVLEADEVRPFMPLRAGSGGGAS